MANGTTGIPYNLPYPLASDSVNVHGDMKLMADQTHAEFAKKAGLGTQNFFTNYNSFVTTSPSPSVFINQMGEGHALDVVGAVSILGNLDAMSFSGDGTNLTNVAILDKANTFSIGQIIEESTNIDALKITNTGIAKSLVIESSSIPFVILSNGQMVHGDIETSSSASLSIISESDDTPNGGILLKRFSNSQYSPDLLFTKSRGTKLSPISVQSNDILGGVLFGGYDGETIENTASIYARVGASVSPGVVPTNIMFYTSSTNSASSLERMVINHDGKVGIGISPTSMFHVQGSDAATTVTIIKSASSQTANLQEWQNASSSVLARVNSSGAIFANGFSNGSAITEYSNIFYATTSAKTPLLLKGTDSQTANLLEIQNNSGTILSSIDTTGGAFFTGMTGIGIGQDTYSAMLSLNTASASRIGQVIRGSNSQTADLQQWQSSDGTPVATMSANGNFTAVTKSFDIPHPSKANSRLRYGSLEGPENGVYVRGRGNGEVIDLPDYWKDLVDESSITVQLTPIGEFASLSVLSVGSNKILIGGSGSYFYFVQAERKDVEKLIVEYKEVAI